MIQFRGQATVRHATNNKGLWSTFSNGYLGPESNFMLLFWSVPAWGSEPSLDILWRPFQGLWFHNKGITYKKGNQHAEKTSPLECSF